ncbi:MAG: methylase [Pseudomonadota bacterium]|nr:methylase [Pseudomonadota bacterium]
MLPASPTRGRTAPGRLAALDAWLCHAEAGLLRRTDGPWATAPFVDIGLGDTPWTTLESAAALRTVRPDLPVVGIDVDRARVAAAQPHADALTTFRLGDFDLGPPDEAARIVRALNVLRQYPPDAIPDIHRRLGAGLLPGGLLIEGTSDAAGGVLVTHLLRRPAPGEHAPGEHAPGEHDPAALRREGLLFHTDFSQGFAPLLFRDRLPRDLRRVAPGTPMHPFFAAWTAAWEAARTAARHARIPPELGPPPELDTPHARFVASVQGLAARVPGVDPDPWLAARGYLVWRPPAAAAGV